MLDVGIHPATRLGLAGNGECCGTCVSHILIQPHNRTFHKCERHVLGISASAASDIRVSWPACMAWVR